MNAPGPRHVVPHSHNPGLMALGLATAFTLSMPLLCGAADAPPPTAPSSDVSQPQPYVPPSDPGALLHIDAEMREYFRARVSPNGSTEARLTQLVDAILRPNGLNFAYDVEGTYDPRTTFERRRGNCLGFSFLVVAVARDLGFSASFQNVEQAPHWDRFGDIIAAVQHVNVRIDTYEVAYAIDLMPDVLRGPDSTTRVIEDNRALAQFYNSIGFFRCVHHDTAEALRLMAIATEIDPSWSAGWANRATLVARTGNLAEAKTCYNRSLRLDSRGLMALDGYVDVLQRLGTEADLKLAAKYQRRANYVRAQNPYYQQYLATASGARGDWIAAEKQMRAAINLKDDDPAFYDQWADALRHLGKDKDVERALRVKARLLDRQRAQSPHFAR